MGKKAALVGFIGAVFWSLCPFAVFYSRLGLIEMMVTSLMFLSFFSFDYAIREKNLKWSVVSGALLSLAILTKYTAFVFVVPMVLVWIAEVLRALVRRLRGKQNFLRLKGPFNSHTARKLFATAPSLLNLHLLLPLAIAGMVTLATVFVFYLHDGFVFKLQAGASLGIFTDWWKDVAGGFWESWSGKIGWWVGWPVLLLGCAGFLLGIGKSFRVFGLFFVITALLITTRKPFNPRYFLTVLPFLCIYAALGLGWISAKLPIPQSVGLRWRNPTGFSLAILLTAVFCLMIPGATTAFQASNHTIIERTGHCIKESTFHIPHSTFLFSNWWPTYFSEPAGVKNTTWLAESVKETNELANTDNRSALTILDQEGGVVALESLYSKDLYTPAVRKVAQDLVERNLKPTEIIEDKQPNFPFYESTYNEIKVYLIQPNVEFK
jgi:hypothetical protein